MALAHCVFDATNENTGALLSSVLVEVRLESSGALVECYSDRNGTVSLGTSFTVSDGRVSFFAVGGAYKITLTAPGHSRVLRYVANGTSAETDVGVVNFAGYTYTFETGTSAPPSTASFRADNADLTAATELFFDDDTLAGDDISSILLSLAPVTGYATNQIRLTDPSNGAQFVANVTAVSDDTDYVTLTISGGVGATSMTVGSVKMDVTWGGKSGANAGYRLQFSTTTTDGNPGAGKFRADNATYGSISKLWVSEADYDGLDITSWLTSFDDNVNASGRGNLIIQDQGDASSKFGFSVTGPVVDKTGYREIPVSPMSGAMPANDTIMIANFTPSGADGTDGSDGANGIDGASNFTRVRVVDTSEGSPASDYEVGDTVDGVTLAENDLVLRATPAGDPADGVYLVPSSGAASRLTAFNSYDSMPGTGFRVMEGAAKANTVWFCESAQGGTLDTTDLVVAEFSAGAASGLTEEMQQYIAANEIRWAEANAEQQFTGVTRFADDFSDLTYVDTAGATNLDTSESGVLKPTVTAGTETVAGAGGSATSGAGYTRYSRVVALTNDQVIGSFKFSSTNSGTFAIKIALENSSTNYTVVYEETYTHGGTGEEDFTITTPYTIPSSGTYRAGVYTSFALTMGAASEARSFNTGDISGTSGGFTANTGDGIRLRMFEVGTTDNLTVVPQSIPCSTAPETMMAMFLVEPTDTITLNTDLLLTLSRDDGTTETSSDLSLYSTLADGTLLYASELTDVSGQPSGTDLLWELTSANSKNFKVHAAFLYFGD